jgi:hypothetical protein
VQRLQNIAETRQTKDLLTCFFSSFAASDQASVVELDGSPTKTQEIAVYQDVSEFGYSNSFNISFMTFLSSSS